MYINSFNPYNNTISNNFLIFIKEEYKSQIFAHPKLQN